MKIRKYKPEDADALFALIEREGEEWSDYYGPNRDKYLKALESSTVYLAFEGDVLLGYCRCRDDDGYGVYVYDLLVDKDYRGKNHGRKFIQVVSLDHEGEDVFIMSDVDEYYEKQGYERHGSIFQA